MSTRLRSVVVPTLAALAVVLIWGLSFVASKAVLNTGFPPLSMAALRFAVASAVLLPLRRWLEPGGRVAAAERLPLVASGIVGVTLYFFFETRGIKLTSASHAALIIATIPVFTLVAERIFHGTPLRWRQGLGIALSVLGVYLVAGHGADPRTGALAGNLAMLGACLSWVAYVMLSRRVHRAGGLGELGITAWQNLIGFAFLVPLAAAERAQWFMPPPAVWANILYLGVFCSALGYFLYQFALARLGPVAVSAYVNLIPVVGAAGGLVLLGEVLAPVQVLGGVVVISGVFLASLGGR